MNMIKVIVAITTFNLEKYISQALESVLSQKTSFPFQIIVADDHSTDKTPDILSRYEEKYSEVIKVLYSERNIGSLANSNRLFDHIDCEYFSFLDGDDYWTDEYRLQKQVDFLDSHREYSMCGGNTQFLRNGVLAEYMIEKKYMNNEYSFEDDILRRVPLVHTSSLLVRNTIFKNGLPQCFKDAVGTFEECALRGENFRRLMHLDKAPLYLMDCNFSVYRIHEKGIWQGTTTVRRMIESAISENYLSKYFKSSYGDMLEREAKKSYENLMIWLLSNKYLLHPNTLSSKDSYLLAGLIEDVSKNDSGAKLRGNSLLKVYLMKLLTEVFHFF